MASLIDVSQASRRDYQSQQLQVNPHLNPDLYKAASKGNFDAFDNHLNLLDLLTPKNNTILHIYITAQTKAKPTNDSKGLMQQNQSSRYQFVEQVLNRCPALLTKANIKGETPLHIAARYGHKDIIVILAAYAGTSQHERDTESGVSSNFWRMTSITNETALHEAARNNHLQVVKLLIQEEPDLVNMCNDARETPFYLAVERGHQDVAAKILGSCLSPAAYDGPSERTVLHAAVITKDAGMTEIILEKTGQLLTKRVDKEGWTPLHYASFFASSELVKLLLQFDKRAAYIQDIDGRTPLLVAATRRHSFLFQEWSANVMGMIIKECPDCCELVDPKGQNVLHLSAKSFNDAAMRVLLEASCLFNLINEKDDEGNTPFHVLANVGFDCKNLVGHCLLDSMAVNDRNLTAADIMETSEFEERKEKVQLRETIAKAKICGSWRHKLQMEPLEKVKERFDKMITELKKAKDSHLVVATLIATVTFAAGFTLPGGYEDDDPNKGYAVLIRRLAFKVFVLTDAITFAMSMSIIFIHFLLASQGRRIHFYWLFHLTIEILPYALGSMGLAFLTGIYAVLPHSYAIAIVNIVIAAIAFMICDEICRVSRSMGHLKLGDEIILGTFENSLFSDHLLMKVAGTTHYMVKRFFLTVRSLVNFFLSLLSAVTRFFMGKK